MTKAVFKIEKNDCRILKNMPLAIKIENLWKEYRLGVINHGTLAKDIQSKWAKIRGTDDPNSAILLTDSSIKDQMEGGTFWALRDINLDVEEGKVLGLVGKNGAGKSTLLKVLSRVTAPTRGKISIKGRIASLLEVGTGFHPELTGSENIFMNGAILGMSKKEIKAKRDEIISFSGVEQYIDTPVKRYSSGMRVRLAFAVAAHLDPEILIIDEVLAVGDVEFQKKCLGRMSQVSQEGRTVLFVSHNLGAVSRICDNAAVIDKGQIVYRGTALDGVSYYLNSFSGKGADSNEGYTGSEPIVFAEDTKKEAQFLKISLSDGTDNLSNEFSFSKDIQLQMSLVVRSERKDYYVLFNLKDIYENVIYISADNDMEDSPLNQSGRGLYDYSVNLPRGLLKPGRYNITVSITYKNKIGSAIDKHVNIMEFSIHDNDSYRAAQSGYRKAALVAPELCWELNHTPT